MRGGALSISQFAVLGCWFGYRRGGTVLRIGEAVMVRVRMMVTARPVAGRGDARRRTARVWLCSAMALLSVVSVATSSPARASTPGTTDAAGAAPLVCDSGALGFHLPGDRIDVPKYLKIYVPAGATVTLSMGGLVQGSEDSFVAIKELSAPLGTYLLTSTSIGHGV